ncbi:MAG: hypothetical protein Q9169_004642 [Polycauliona sp. 2 TL-2023]
MRRSVTEPFALSDVAHPQSLDDLRVVPKQLTATSEPRHNSERAGLKASVSGVLSAPLPTPLGEHSNPGSPKAEADDRRASIASLSGDIDMLVNRFDEAKIETAAPSNSQRIQVPKGYGLGLACNSSMFYKERSEAKQHDKRKRDLGLLPKLSGPQKHGFRPEDLLWYDAITLKNCKCSNLDNDIHPLLDRDRFDDTPDHIYDQLIPGLRLASLFLSHPSCIQFWVTLAKGERRVDHIMSERYHKPRHRISRHVPMTSENVKEVIGYMENLGNAKAIHFTFADALKFHDSSAFGTSHTICTHQADLEETHVSSSPIQRCHVRLHSDFYIIAKKLSHMVYPDPAQKLRFNLILATLIVHEMAHAIELSQWRNRAPSPFEPFLLHQNEAELGRAWESCMFGGQTTPINDRVDGIYGIGTWDWPRPFGEMNPERTICYALPMKFVENIQQKSTWQQEYDLSSCQTRFHVPRDGATSIYMNSVTTVSWTEEERVAKEAMQEQQVLDSEEPAKKKRETADGKALPIHEIGVEPTESISPKKKEPNEDGDDDGERKKGHETAAQAVNRVKREPMGVMSRRQRRLQRKKTPLSKKESESEEPFDPDPEDPVEQPPDVEAEEKEKVLIEDPKAPNNDSGEGASKAAATKPNDNHDDDDDSGVDISATTTPSVQLPAKNIKPDTTTTTNSNEDTPEKNV